MSSTNAAYGSRGRGRSNGGRSRGAPLRNTANYFKGDVKAMNGNIFGTHAERSKPGQFQDTVDALKILASTEYKKDIMYLEPLFKKLEEPKVPLPIKPEAETEGSLKGAINPVKLDIYQEKVRAYGKTEERLKATTTALYNIAWSQCSKLLRNKLKLSPDFERIEDATNVAALLKEIRGISYQIDPNQSIYDAIDELQKQFFAYRQEDANNVLHLARFKDYVDVLEHFGIEMFQDECCVEHEEAKDKAKGLKPLSHEGYVSRVKEKRLATCLLRRSNMQIYGPLMRELRDNYLHKLDVYPNTLDEAYTLLQSHSSARRKEIKRPARNRGSQGNSGAVQDRGNSGASRDRGNENGDVVGGIQHAQRGGESDPPPLEDDDDEEAGVMGINGVYKPDVTCWRCKKRGHYADKCPTYYGMQNNNNNSEEAGTTKKGVQHHIEGAILSESDSSSDDESVIIGFTHAAREGEQHIDKNSILLDTGSNCSVFNNKKYLINIRKSANKLRAFTNGGHQDSDMVGGLPHFFDVWYNPDSLMNILSFSEVAKKYRITMDSSKSNIIKVHLNEDGKCWKFSKVDSGLYLLNSNSDKYINTSVTNYSCLTLVSDNEAKYNNREIKMAKLAQKFYTHCNCPGYIKFIAAIENNSFRNIPFTVEDIKRAIAIYGKDVNEMKGKGTRTRPIPISDIVTIRIPPSILQLHNDIQLSVDFIFVQGIPMLHSISGTSYQFRTLHPIFKERPNKLDIQSGIKAVLNIYQSRGIRIRQINADNEFNCVKSDFLPTPVNIVAAEEHVGDVEKSIRTLKDGTRTHVCRLPYRRYPRAMVAGAAMHTLISLNQMPANNGISTTLSPSTLVTGKAIPDFNHIIKLNFGEYVLTSSGKTSSDVTSPRKIGAIALYPSNNHSGGWYFMSLTTGYVIHRYSWDIQPVSQDVIQRVEEIATKQKQHKVKDSFVIETTNTYQNTNVLTDVTTTPDVEVINTPTEEPRIDEENNNTLGIEAVDTAINTPEITQEGRTEVGVENVAEERNEDPVDEIIGDQVEIIDDNNDNNRLSTPGNLQPDDSLYINNISQEENREDSQINLENESIEESDINTENIHGLEVVGLTSAEDQRDGDHRENTETANEQDNTDLSKMTLRRKNRPDYRVLHRSGDRRQLLHMYKKVKRKLKKKYKVKISDTFRKIVGIVMTQMQATSDFEQMNMKQGLKMFGQKAVEAVIKEYAQLDMKGVFEGVYSKDLTIKQKKEALELFTLIKLKRCGKVKARACANGKKQRRYIKKETISSPTAQLESLILTLMIDAFEGRDTATADVTGAYLYASMPDLVLVKLREESVELLCASNKEYEKFITYEHGKKVLYLKLAKALYGCLQSALLWYETFVTCLKDIGFEINKYDPCVANKIINGKQCTICWYVDDTKISHVDPKVVSWVIEQIEQRFGKMSVVRGSEHTFVGMKFKHIGDSRVQITMPEYINECIKSFESISGEVKGKANTPGKHELFTVDKESVRLSEKKADMFHHIVSKLLYVSKRARLDIDLVISFMCTRVSKSTEEDWEKLERLIKYLKGTMEMVRIIGADSLDVMKTWVDASYATHTDMRGHTGGVISLGTGVVNNRSSKQKINTKSSTETEVVGASDFLPWTIWTKRFMEEQGYQIRENIYYQDNESAIKLEKNGRKSCGEKSRHINIRYFFIKDVCKRENISIEHCRTDIMIADFFTKPLQGKLFRKMRDGIMGLGPFPHEERVEEKNTKDKVACVKDIKPKLSYAEIVRGNIQE